MQTVLHMRTREKYDESRIKCCSYDLFHRTMGFALARNELLDLNAAKKNVHNQMQLENAQLPVWMAWECSTRKLINCQTDTRFPRKIWNRIYISRSTQLTIQNFEVIIPFIPYVFIISIRFFALNTGYHSTISHLRVQIRFAIIAYCVDEPDQNNQCKIEFAFSMCSFTEWVGASMKSDIITDFSESVDVALVYNILFNAI